MNSTPQPSHQRALADQSSALSVDKALLIFELLMREEAPLSAREVAERLRINRTTAHRLLNALIHRGWIERADGKTRYQVSLKFLALARLSFQAHDFISEIRPALKRLSHLSREAVHVGVLDGYEIVHVDKVDSPERVGISSKIGSRAVTHVTGLGKAILAACSDAFLEEYFAYAQGLPAPYTVDDPHALRQELLLTRERGYSIDNEEDSIGVRCLGVAILGAGGIPLFAISLTGPSPRFTLQRVESCTSEVMAEARALSMQFGWDLTLR